MVFYNNLILLVEDNSSDEKLALRALSRMTFKCEVAVARDGVEAVDYLLSPDNQVPHLILLDLKLPRMNGHEVLATIRKEKRTSSVPVVCLTSSTEQSDIVGCFDGGANSFVRKVVEFDAYMERLAKVAEYWLTINEPCRS